MSFDTARGVRARIEDAARRLQAEESRLAAAAAEAEADLAALAAREAAAQAALARHRLQTLAEDGPAAALDRAEREAHAILERRRSVLEAARARVVALEEAERAATRARDARSAALDEVEAAIAALEETVEAAIAADPAWVRADEELSRLAEQVENAREKAARAEGERAEKRAPYDADPLFAYLERRGFGTSAYAGGAFARWGDAKVARLIGYDELRRDYRMLVEIPDRLRAHAERLAGEADAAEARLEAIERAALVAAGIEPLEQARAGAEAELAQAQADLAAATQALATARAEAAGPDDPELARALAILVEAIARDDVRRLEADAAATPSPEDDRLVAEIAAARQGVAAAQERLAAARAALAQARRRAAEATRALTDYDSGRFDRNGRFDNGSAIGSAIEGLLAGAGARILEEALRSGYRAPRPSRSTASSRPARGARPRPSGGFRTGGSFGGGRSGGFRTGGRF
jgi:chromosome segregation ATPase